MPYCEHLDWLQISHDNESSLIEPYRLRHLIQEFPHATSQYPSLIFFIGPRAKDLAIRQLFPWNNFKKSRKDGGFATLRAEMVSLQSEFPLLLAESDPTVMHTPLLETNQSCHEVQSHPLLWPQDAIPKIYNFILARLLFLFTDVICVFADDFPDLDSVLRQLQAWAVFGWATDLFKAIRPRVIVVKKGNQPSPSPLYDLLDREDLHFNFRQQELVCYFLSITVLHLADEQISSLARHRCLKELLQRQTEQTRHLRQTHGCLYSATHFTDLFTDAVRHTSCQFNKPFDFLVSIRRRDCDFVDYVEHLSNFTHIAIASKVSWRNITRYIASTILLDAYAPRSHRT